MAWTFRSCGLPCRRSACSSPSSLHPGRNASVTPDRPGGLCRCSGRRAGTASRYLSVELVAAIALGLAFARPLPGGSWRAPSSSAPFYSFPSVSCGPTTRPGRELAFAAERTVNRIVLIQPRTLDALQAAIPAEEPFFNGLTWLRRLGPLLRRRDDIPNLGYWIYPRLFPDQVTPGYAAPGLLGEAWANFGWLGIACSRRSASWSSGSGADLEAQARDGRRRRPRC